MKIFDLHCDTADKIYNNNVGLIDNNFGVSFEKLELYEEFIQVFAMWVDGRKISTPKDYILKMIKYFKLNLNLQEINKYRKKIKPIISIEGGEAIEDDIENVEIFYNEGIRIITLLWNNENNIGTPCNFNDNYGIKTFGKKVINKMNEKNMIVDLSHVNYQGFFDACEIADKIIVSHSNSYSVCNNKRNITDEQFKEIKKKCGLVGINYYPPFLNNTNSANISDVIKHIYHFLSLDGEKNICIGSDFDGIDFHTKQLNNAKDHINLYEEMLKMNFNEKTVKDIMYNNCKNYFKINKI